MLALVIGDLRAQTRPRFFDVVGVSAATLLPTAMTVWDAEAGALQSLMFAIVHAWYASEAWRRRRTEQSS